MRKKWKNISSTLFLLFFPCAALVNEKKRKYFFGLEKSKARRQNHRKFEENSHEIISSESVKWEIRQSSILYCQEKSVENFLDMKKWNFFAVSESRWSRELFFCHEKEEQTLLLDYFMLLVCATSTQLSILCVKISVQSGNFFLWNFLVSISQKVFFLCVDELLNFNLFFAVNVLCRLLFCQPSNLAHTYWMWRAKFSATSSGTAWEWKVGGEEIAKTIKQENMSVRLRLLWGLRNVNKTILKTISQNESIQWVVKTSFVFQVDFCV